MEHSISHSYKITGWRLINTTDNKLKLFQIFTQMYLLFHITSAVTKVNYLFYQFYHICSNIHDLKNNKHSHYLFNQFIMLLWKMGSNSGPVD